MGMENAKRPFSSIQVNLPESLANEIINWGKENIKEDDIFRDPDAIGYGREDEIHVTILYGIHTETPDQAKKILNNKPFVVRLGKIGIFTNEKFDVIKIKADSDKLHQLNSKLARNLVNTNRFTSYQPHVTIAYVKKGTGWKFSGDAAFNNRTFEAKEAIFSSKSSKRTIIYFK